jgi:hypothetical protein
VRKTVEANRVLLEAMRMIIEAVLKIIEAVCGQAVYFVLTNGDLRQRE